MDNNDTTQPAWEDQPDPPFIDGPTAGPGSHTPGPWETDDTYLKFSDCDLHMQIWCCNPTIRIGFVESQNVGTAAAEANACLIAAAPELLAACRFVVRDVQTAGEDAELTADGYNRLCDAIAKATQTSPARLPSSTGESA